MQTPYFSVVIPVFNEEGNLPELHRRLCVTLEKIGKPFEILFVDDGSRDGSYLCMLGLFERDRRVRIIKFSRNFGHHIAVTAGIDAARGEAVILMDADLQDQPEEIEKLYAKFTEGYDVVYGIRTERKHSWFKRWTSSLFLKIMNRIVSGAHSINTNIFRIVRRNVIEAVKGCREYARFIVGLVSWVGFRQVGVEVKHGERYWGVTKYSMGKMIRLALNAMTSFSILPLQVATLVGVVVSIGSFIGGIAIVARKIFLDTAVEGWTSLMVALLFVSGVQLLCLGAIGEYVGRTYRETQRRPLYVVEALVQADASAGESERLSA